MFHTITSQCEKRRGEVYKEQVASRLRLLGFIRYVKISSVGRLGDSCLQIGNVLLLIVCIVLRVTYRAVFTFMLSMFRRQLYVTVFFNVSASCGSKKPPTGGREQILCFTEATGLIFHPRFIMMLLAVQ